MRKQCTARKSGKINHKPTETFNMIYTYLLRFKILLKSTIKVYSLVKTIELLHSKCIVACLWEFSKFLNFLLPLILLLYCTHTCQPVGKFKNFIYISPAVALGEIEAFEGLGLCLHLVQLLLDLQQQIEQRRTAEL